MGLTFGLLRESLSTEGNTSMHEDTDAKPPIPTKYLYNPSFFHRYSTSNTKTLGASAFDELMWSARHTVHVPIAPEQSEEELRREFFSDL